MNLAGKRLGWVWEGLGVTGCTLEAGTCVATWSSEVKLEGTVEWSLDMTSLATQGNWLRIDQGSRK